MGACTPMMQQYLLMKEKYADCLLFFRLGDFYEMFFEDAVKVSALLELTLTGRDCGAEQRAPMCGVPYHAVDGYINKLLEKGFKVAICEQITDPSESKGLVERDVVRVITPGTIIENSMLDERANNYILSIYRENEEYGIAWADVSTGEFRVAQFTGADAAAQLNNHIATIKPAEIIANDAMLMSQHLLYCMKLINSPLLNGHDNAAYVYDMAEKLLLSHFSAKDLPSLGLGELPMAVCAAGALIHYLYYTQKNSLLHIAKVLVDHTEEFMSMDASTRRNLELTEPIRGKGKKGTLIGLLDKTSTAMGGRELRAWVEKPLASIKSINKRLDSVEELVNSFQLREDTQSTLKKVYDIERLCSKVAYGSINARECLSLGQSLSLMPGLKQLLSGCKSGALKEIHTDIDPLEALGQLLIQAISPDAPVSPKDSGVIREGYHEELDEMRGMAVSSKDWIASLEAQERENTGIKNLKIGFNKVFGYYIEVTKSYLSNVPYGYIRKQTLANCERYVTQELKEMEEKLFGIEERMLRLEYRLFTEIREKIAEQLNTLQKTARAVARLDALNALAVVASEYHYCKPQMHSGSQIEVKNGRHPVVERMTGDEQFVPNDTILDNKENRLIIITGPNMAGKSTYMRQVALITLLAHIGSFVPADSARIAVTDRIFTRVGASDDLAAGQSTFMVEMSEVAHILRNATSKSLLILDEIGRGTSTFDGLSIAWAVAEHVAGSSLGAKTLFATHYHELSELEGRLDGVKNYSIAVKEHGDDVIFLRKVRRGSADKSFGIQVARLAGLPDSVLARAKEILGRLEAADINNQSLSESIFETGSGASAPAQMSLLIDTQSAELLRELAAINIDGMTPLQAMSALYEFKEKAKRV